MRNLEGHARVCRVDRVIICLRNGTEPKKNQNTCNRLGKVRAHRESSQRRVVKTQPDGDRQFLYAIPSRECLKLIAMAMPFNARLRRPLSLWPSRALALPTWVLCHGVVEIRECRTCRSWGVSDLA